MPDPRQITDLPVATEANNPDLLLLRQGLFDKQVEVGILRAGTLLAANNLSDVADAATARANLGVVDPVGFLEADNNLSDLDDAAVARSNLGVSATADVLLVANNLSDIADAATARANLGVVEATNTAVVDDTNDFDFNQQLKMQIRNYSETVNNAGTLTGAVSFDVEVANNHYGTVTDDITVSFVNPAASDQSSVLFLELVNAGAHSVTWPGSVVWPAGTAPTLTETGTDLLVFVTRDNGTTWFGVLAGADFS